MTWLNYCPGWLREVCMHEKRRWERYNIFNCRWTLLTKHLIICAQCALFLLPVWCRSLGQSAWRRAFRRASSRDLLVRPWLELERKRKRSGLMMMRKDDGQTAEGWMRSQSPTVQSHGASSTGLIFSLALTEQDTHFP
jgi:hypothetical protein